MHIFDERESEIRGYVRAWPVVFASASNARQTDTEGKSYIDFFAGAGVLNFGHNHPKMKEAVIAFLQQDGVVHSLDMATSAKRDFMQAFVETILDPRGLDYKMQFMGPTGTNAVEAALKLARRVTGRRHVVAFSHGFHGMTLGSLSCTANQAYRGAAGVPLEHVIRLPHEHAAGGGVEALRALRCAWRDPSSGLEAPAAFLVETIQAEGGVNVASAEWLKELEVLARDLGALLIVDDIQTGIGRTGSFFSFDEMGITPDIVTLAKGIGGFGTPMAMNLVRPEHDRHWKPGEHTGTFRGQGISFVAGREMLRWFEEDAFMQEVRAKGRTMRERLEEIAAQHPARDLEVRGRGMMQGIDLFDGGLAKKAAAAAFEKGLLLWPCGSEGRVLKLIPPLTIPQSDLDEGLELLAAAIHETLEAA